MTFVETLASEATRYVIVIVMVAGLYTIIARGNLIKKLVGLSLFQSSVYLLYLLPAKIFGGTAPILDDRFEVYSNPLPHVLILTAIVVGIGTLALGLVLPYTLADYVQNIVLIRLLSNFLNANPDSLAFASALTVTSFALAAVPIAVIATFYLAGRRPV